MSNQLEYGRFFHLERTFLSHTKRVSQGFRERSSVENSKVKTMAFYLIMSQLIHNKNNSHRKCFI